MATAASLSCGIATVPGARNPGKLTVRTIDVTAAGHDMLADSRLVLQVPPATVQGGHFTQPCVTSLAAGDGRSIVCSTTGGNTPAAACPAAPPSFVSYSTATGRPLKVSTVTRARA